MERESFEDTEVAELLNRDFVAIKVDREERPDIDHLYMAICQAMTGQGGWPLTIVMTPEKKPFFAGTYFPKQQKYGRYGLMEILPQLTQKWRTERDQVEELSNRIVVHTKENSLGGKTGEIDLSTVHAAYDLYSRTFDSRYGGFGRAPKFPTPHNLSFLLRYATLFNNEHALEMAEQTLMMMFRGGMYDHIGFGFARYSTDERWLVPHFEKMLYDNALLAISYTEAYLATGKIVYREIAEQILEYVLRDMTDAEGGFYSAEDADSEGEEGKFYVWTPDEIEEVLGPEDAALFNKLYGISEEGNFDGANISNLLAYTLESFSVSEGVPVEQMRERIGMAREKLFEFREKRIHPYKDDKILTSWNGLMIAAISMAGRAFGNPKFVEAAKRSVNFVFDQLRREDGRLLARYRDGEAAHPGYVDDYSFMVWGLVELYETTFDHTYLESALELNRQMLELFWDEDNGGFFFYGSDGEELFARLKETYDGALPSGNSVAAINLIRLARLTGDEQLEQRFREQLQATAGAVEQYPAGHAMMLMALLHAYAPSREIVIAGRVEDERTKSFMQIVQQSWLPNTVVMFHPVDGGNETTVRQLMPVITDKTDVNGEPAVYICENYSCQAPITELDQLSERLQL